MSSLLVVCELSRSIFSHEMDFDLKTSFDIHEIPSGGKRQQTTNYYVHSSSHLWQVLSFQKKMAEKLWMAFPPFGNQFASDVLRQSIFPIFRTWYGTNRSCDDSIDFSSAQLLEIENASLFRVSRNCPLPKSIATSQLIGDHHVIIYWWSSENWIVPCSEAESLKVTACYQ